MILSWVSGRFAQRSIRQMAIRPDYVDSPDLYLSFFKPNKKEQTRKDSDCTCGIQG